MQEPSQKIPYRMLLPEGVDGLPMAARGAGYIQRGHDGPGTRPASMMTLGQAAGTAAALSARHGVIPKALDVKILQRKLLAAGIQVGDPHRLRELGLQ